VRGEEGSGPPFDRLGDRSVELVAELPALGPAFVRALLPRGGGTARVPERTVVLAGLRQDSARYATYSRTCGFTLRDHVPPTWLFVLSFPLQVHLLADPAATLRLVGVVHVANRMVLHRPVGVAEPLDLVVRADNLRARRRGVLVDLVSRAEVGDEVVWECVSTYLSTGVTLPESPSGEPEEPAREPFEPVRPQALWRLPADLGRRYRAVAGDPNPIHTSRLVARAFGFARPITHGMWTHARVLAALEHRLPPAYRVDAQFTRPILLPGTVGFHAAPGADGLSAAVTTPDGTRPHLLVRTNEG
jgi:hypothetical protein